MESITKSEEMPEEWRGILVLILRIRVMCSEESTGNQVERGERTTVILALSVEKVRRSCTVSLGDLRKAYDRCRERR